MEDDLRRLLDELSAAIERTREGDEDRAFPGLMRGRVYADFRHEPGYFLTLFQLISTLYRIPFDAPEFAELRETLDPSAGDELRAVTSMRHLTPGRP